MHQDPERTTETTDSLELSRLVLTSLLQSKEEAALHLIKTVLDPVNMTTETTTPALERAFLTRFRKQRILLRATIRQALATIIFPAK